MSPQNFVSSLYGAVVVENGGVYRDLFMSTASEGASDPYCKRALSLFNGLDAGERETLLEIMRQVSVDTVANVLGIIDGVNSLEGVDEQINLVVGNVGIGGDLQGLFLEMDERERQ